MQNSNKNKRGAAVIKRELDEAKGHVRCVVTVCAAQVRENRFSLSERPATATSWDIAEVKKVQGLYCIGTVEMDMCCFGMTAIDDGREAAISKVHKAYDQLARDCLES